MRNDKSKSPASRSSSPLEVRIPYHIPPNKLDADAVDIVRRLVHYGHEAYLVGGCIRDIHQGLPPKDFDLVTSARPNQIKKMFRNCRIIGRRFRLAHIHTRGKIFEVSTFRGMDPDAETLGGRRGEFGDNVFGTAEEDAMRRDFTINALYYDVDSEEIIDYVGGFTDLRRHLIRCIGDPDLRLEEDPVRMIRAIKLAAKVNFRLDPPLADAMHYNRRLIRESSPARILEELFKILGSGAAARTLEYLADFRLLEHLLPEFTDMLPSGEEADHAIGYRYLDALDVADRGLRIHSNAVLLGALFLPLLDPKGTAIGLTGKAAASPPVAAPPPVAAGSSRRKPLTIQAQQEDDDAPYDYDYDDGRDREWPRTIRSSLKLSMEASQVVRGSPILRNLPRRELHQLGQIIALQQKLATATRATFKRLTQKAGFEDAARLFDIACAAHGVEPESLELIAPYLEHTPRVEPRRDEQWRPGFAEGEVEELDFEANFDEEDQELADLLFPGDGGSRRRRSRSRRR